MNYRFSAKDPHGETIMGRSACSSERELVLWLRERSLVPLDIRRTRFAGIAGGERGLAGFWPRVGIKPPLNQMANFFRSLAMLLSSGISLASSLQIVIEQSSSSRIKYVLESVADKVSSGAAFSSALDEFSGVFDPLCVAFARSGEEAGLLADNMTALAAALESRERLRRKIVSARIYPAIVMIIAMAVLAVMAAVVIPKFESAYSALGVAMPPLTAFIFKLGQAAKSRWYLLPTAVLVLKALVILLQKNKLCKLYLSGIALKLPIIGKLLLFAALQRSFATMACLLNAGVPLAGALAAVGPVAGNARVREAFERTRAGALAGVHVNAVMAGCNVFPRMDVHLVRVGEETGRSSEIFAKLAERYESDLEERARRLTSSLEPLLVVFVGAVVGLMAVAIFMPVVSAIENFV